MTMGERIQQLRKSAGLTQSELGEKVGVKKNAVSKWECGRVEDIPLSTVRELASLFGVSVTYLIEDKTTELELTKEQWEKLKPATQAEWSRFVLKALISYHERITMGGHPDLECWKRGLEFAVSCVQKEIDREDSERER